MDPPVGVGVLDQQDDICHPLLNVDDGRHLEMNPRGSWPKSNGLQHRDRRKS
jgi:hypothetical protein